MWLRIIILPEELTLLLAHVEHYICNIGNTYTYICYISSLRFSCMYTFTLRDIFTVLVSLRIRYITEQWGKKNFTKLFCETIIKKKDFNV